MASIFRPKRKVTDPATGKTKSVAYEHWYIKYRDASGIIRKVKGFTDKVATQQRAAELERQAEHCKAGLVNPFAIYAKTPLAEHLAAFQAALLAKRATSKQVGQATARVQKIIDGCRFVWLADLVPSAIASFLGERRQAGMSIATSNGYLSAVKSFVTWLVKDGRLPSNPLAHLSKLNDRVDIRHERRALTPNELARLIEAAARSRETFRGLNGPTRAMLYRVATMTGLRASELASLTPASFDLTSDPPTVTIEAAYSKHRREDVLPVHPDLAARLRQWLSERDQPTDDQRAVLTLANATDAKPERLFPGTWALRAFRMIGGDLKSAGIPYATDAGYADFHSLRHTFVSNLAAGGVHPKLAQQLARHSTITLTMDRYAHVGLLDVSGALESLPNITAPVTDKLQATGTTDTPPDFGCTNGCNDPAEISRFQPLSAVRTSVKSSGDENAKKPCFPAENKGGRGEKTKRRWSESNRRWRICNPLP